MTKYVFFALIDLCIKEGSYFVFNGKVYVQVQGLPMGSPLSPVLAAILLDALIEGTEEEWKVHVKYMKKYVDDFIGVVR